VGGTVKTGLEYFPTALKPSPLYPLRVSGKHRAQYKCLYVLVKPFCPILVNHLELLATETKRCGIGSSQKIERHHLVPRMLEYIQYTLIQQHKREAIIFSRQHLQHHQNIPHVHILKFLSLSF
jgi:hypothetical protein